MKSALNLKKELVASLVVCLLIFLGTLWEIPPFSSTMDLGESIKESWEENEAESPGSHAELLSMTEFAEQAGIPLDDILKALEAEGYRVSGIDKTLGNIAEENGVSPDDLYQVIKAGAAEQGVTLSSTTESSGGGLGQKRLADLCNEEGIPIETALAALNEKGIAAGPDNKIREIATGAGVAPMEILNIIGMETH